MGRQIEVAGVRAVPIILLMSFLIGGIIAQQGAFQLNYFGAAVFTVDLVGILSLREIAPILTAIMVAGRSGSAITAELGSMQMREEIDALQRDGPRPGQRAGPAARSGADHRAAAAHLPRGARDASRRHADALVVRRHHADGIHRQRLRYAIDFSSFWSGLIKAPFMAFIIALIACTEGMAVRGSAESLGTHTTAAVVKSIFMVIVVDGIFAVFYAGDRLLMPRRTAASRSSR